MSARRRRRRLNAYVANRTRFTSSTSADAADQHPTAKAGAEPLDLTGPNASTTSSTEGHLACHRARTERASSAEKTTV
jgi:hypothetical protein